MMIMDDRLIVNTLQWWYFGPDNTGDIMTLKYLTGLQNFISDMATVHLITADGSFDCQGNPGEQEALVSSLHYCEVVTALTTLGNGGSFVLKMFTLFEHCSINLMYLLNCSFDEVHVFKPATSKAGNSEVYVAIDPVYFYGSNECAVLEDREEESRQGSMAFLHQLLFTMYHERCFLKTLAIIFSPPALTVMTGTFSKTAASFYKTQKGFDHVRRRRLVTPELQLGTWYTSYSKDRRGLLLQRYQRHRTTSHLILQPTDWEDKDNHPSTLKVSKRNN
ncbi:Cap-specific mRNA (nucleoside-2'-O-)-methyltransferase 2 [Manis javanica]|nr:Cap-specific mRNA (nucleoside-2'-O-)-methyltransferase 2 [Manis javanica]